MRIAMLTNNYKPFVGGVPISIERLSNSLRSLGHEVYICLLYTSANYGNVDIFISIHHNACPGGYGSECLCIKDGQQNALSERLSKVILEEVCKLGFRNRGVKDRRDLYVINNTTMPAIIVECAFVDSARDMNGYNSEKMAEAIFRGVCKFYGIENSSCLLYTS